MRLRDYIMGQRFVLRSRRSVDHVTTRIREGSANIFNPFASGVSGWCRFGHLRLWWSTPFFSNGFQPTFSARLRESLGGTELHARFGASLYLRIFFSFWYGLLLVAMIFLVGALLGDGPKTGNEPLGFLIVPLFMAIPIVLHLIFNRNADQHLEEILGFLIREGDMTLEFDGTRT